MKKIYIMLTALFVMSFCNAQNYYLGYKEGTTLHLGQGFLINAPGSTFIASPFDTLLIDTTPNAGLITSYYFINNSSSLQTALGMEGYLSVSSVGYDVGLEYGLNSSSFFSTNSITLAISIASTYGDRHLNSNMISYLTPQAQSYITNNDWAGFEGFYGDSYVQQENLGVSGTLFLTLTNLSESTYNTVSAALNASVSGGLTSAEVGTTLNSLLQSQSASSSLSIQIHVSGGAFSPGFNSIIQAAAANPNNPVDSITSAFSSEMTTISNISNAVPTGFWYSSFKQLFNTNVNSLPTCKLNLLKQICDEYWDIQGKMAVLNQVLASPYYNDFHNLSDDLEATRLNNEYQAALNNLADLHSTVMGDPCPGNSCCFSPPNFIFNSALINNFIHLPFSNCTNNYWTESYPGTKTFTLTSINDITVPLSIDFFNCLSSNQVLANTRVNTTVAGTVWNSGGTGQCGIPGGWYWFQPSLTTTTSLGSNVNQQPGLPGIAGFQNTGFSQSSTDSIGADGNFGVELSNWSVTCSNSTNLSLKAGSTITIVAPLANPTIPAIITPSDVTICQGDSVTLTANFCSGCQYSWYLNSLPTGITTQSITVAPNASCYYTVNVSDNVSSTMSYWANITVYMPPAIPTITGSPSICQGSYVLLTANSAGCNNCTYTWLPSNNVGSTIYATSAGTYSVIASNACPPAATSLPKVITAIQPPANPTFTVNCSGTCYLITPTVPFVAYQWQLNHNDIPGATSSLYIATVPGYYRVIITDTITGCSAISSMDTLLLPVGVNEYSPSNQMSVYPNPANNKIYIQASSLGLNKEVIVTIINMLGGVMQEEKLKWKGDATLDISNLSTGVYLLQFKTEDTRIVSKFAKE